MLSLFQALWADMTGTLGEDNHMLHPYLMQTETQKMAEAAMTMIQTLNTLILIPSQVIPHIHFISKQDIHEIS